MNFDRFPYKSRGAFATYSVAPSELDNTWEVLPVPEMAQGGKLSFLPRGITRHGGGKEGVLIVVQSRLRPAVRR